MSITVSNNNRTVNVTDNNRTVRIGSGLSGQQSDGVWFNSFAGLDALVLDKSLFNLSDNFTIEGANTFTGDNTLTGDNTVTGARTYFDERVIIGNNGNVFQIDLTSGGQTKIPLLVQGNIDNWPDDDTTDPILKIFGYNALGVTPENTEVRLFQADWNAFQLMTLSVLDASDPDSAAELKFSQEVALRFDSGFGTEVSSVRIQEVLGPPYNFQTMPSFPDYHLVYGGDGVEESGFLDVSFYVEPEGGGTSFRALHITVDGVVITQAPQT